MSFLERLFGKPARKSAPTAPNSVAPDSRADGRSSVPPATGLRRELLRLALRQTLKGNGIPPQWVGAESMEVASRTGPGIHVRLQLLHWDPRLIQCTMAFQEDFERRLLAIEPLAKSWLRGFSWQYQLPEGMQHSAMPDPATWGEVGPLVQPITVAPQAGDAAAARNREELNRIFAQQDQAAAGRPVADFEKTQPISRHKP